MNRITNIKGIKNEITSFEQSLQGCNYVVNLQIKTFHANNPTHFSIQDLQTIFDKHKNEINGTTKLVDFYEAQQTIECYLRYCGNGDTKGVRLHGVLLEILEEQEWYKRIENFWALINSFIKFPIAHSYIHLPQDYVGFSYFMMWGFCFILINKQGNGIVINAGAED